MESPAKKRSLFGFSSFFRSSTAPASENDAASRSAAASSSTESPMPARIESGNASAPESPVKRASDAQLASRKIIGRPQGPSSKLYQSMSASDFDRPSSLPPQETSTPKRRPGDNPYKTSTYSSATISHPPLSIQRSTNFSGTSSTPRTNLFRSSLYAKPGMSSTFSPRIPTNVNQSFPPATPGRTPRAAVADVSSRGFANTTSSELFEMRIPEPPRHLTGEHLTRELKDLPKDPSRAGSIYADEYLAHLCPPDLDEHQRRQFFCILDLRRLKYSADEVFTSKDWKINVKNFATEYEKNRGLIMLRYGLYEFKTVRVSEAAQKEWMQKHGIPDPDSEMESSPGGRGKRKAEEELRPANSALTSSTSNANKRARAPDPSPVKTKRKASAEPDENQPAKLQKPATTPQKTPSATKSVFESIANKSTSATPAKPAQTNNLFSTSAPKLANGNSGRSVFETGLKAAASTSNIFSHLSDTSKGSPNDDADAESETDSEGPEGDVTPSAAASGDAPTPQFGAAKASGTLNGTSSSSSDGGESTQSRSIFDRITRGADGQPVRQLEAGKSLFAASPDKERSASPAKEPASTAPANNTWNANTPIKFSSDGGKLFGTAASQPAAVDFGAKKPEAAPEQPAKQPTQNLFGGFPKKTDEPAAKPAPTGLFGSAAPASTGTNLFGSAPPAFGQSKAKEENKASPAASTPASSLFGVTPAAPSPVESTLKPSQPSALFGKTETTAPAPAASLFGKPPSTETPAAQPATSLFGQAKPLFGQTSTASSDEPPVKKVSFGSSSTDAAKPAAAESKPIFGSASTSTGAPETKNLFGATTTTPAAAPAKNLFGAMSAAPQEPKPLFGAAPAAKSEPAKSLFGGTSATPAEAPKHIFGAAPAPAEGAKPIFGTAPASQAEAPKHIFGAAPAPAEGAKPLFGAASTEAAKPAGSIFGNLAPVAAPAAASSGPIFSFGSQTSAPSQSQQTQPAGAGSIFGTGGGSSFSFTAGGDGASFTNPFASGNVSAPTSFNFGSGGGSSDNNAAQPGSASFTFGAGATPSFSFGGASDSTQPTQQTSTSFSAGTPSFTFGASSSQPNGTSTNIFAAPPTSTGMFGNSLAPGGGTSTGTNSPFTFGGASSLATTPATGTPEPSAAPEESRGTNADGDDAPQEQISLTESGPGEEDESVVHEIRVKAVKLVVGGESDDESSSADKNKPKNPWKTKGVGPLRILKHKTTGAVRMLLRAEPRGHIALNKLVLPNFNYKVDPPGGKYVKLTTATDSGMGLETWMLQVKTPDAAKALAEALETYKKDNAKKE